MGFCNCSVFDLDKSYSDLYTANSNLYITYLECKEENEVYWWSITDLVNKWCLCIFTYFFFYYIFFYTGTGGCYWWIAVRGRLRHQPVVHPHLYSRLKYIQNINSLALNAPITTKVVCFSRLLKCLRNLYGKQRGPRSDCSSVLGPRCLLLYLIHQSC